MLRLHSLFSHLVAMALLALPLHLRAQATPANLALSQASEHRVALVVGNAAYRDSPLKNPVNDARAMRDKLKSLGFAVVYFENLQSRQVGGALREFRSLIRPGSVALFFYAGHGLQVRGENFLPTVDAELSSEEDVPNQSLNLARVLNAMEDSKAAVNLVLLDACRNNPYARNFRSSPTGLARVQAPSGTLIHYATRPGSVAEDGGGSHGTYTEALLAQIDEKGVPIETALKRVTVRVRDVTKGKQEPWMEGSLTGDFYFIVNGGSPQITVQQAPTTADAAAWQAADSTGTAVAYQAYLGEYPSGLYAAAARIKLASLRPAGAATAAPAALAAPTAAALPPLADATPAGPPPLLAPVPPGTKDADGFVWRDVQAKGAKAHFEAYLQQFPRGRYAVAARLALKRLDQREAEVRAQEVAAAEPGIWQVARQAHTQDAYRAFLQDYPKGRFAAQALAALKTLEQAAAAAAAAAPAVLAVSPRQSGDTGAPAQRVLTATEREALRAAALRELKPARISGAEFMMGADTTEPGENGPPDETAQPQRSVKVDPFELAPYEVTVAQFRKFVDATGYVTEAERPGQGGCHGPGKAGAWVPKASTHWRAPGHAQTDSHPVVCVSFADVQAYLLWLNGSAERYRLPSEAEWEFAARGGTTSPRPWSDVGGFFARAWGAVKPGSSEPVSRACKYANLADETARKQLELPATINCDDGYPAAVPGGYYSRNNFGLYDMMGNVAEWTQDCWNASHTGAAPDARVRSQGDCSRRVVRGASWASAPHTVRSAARLSQPQNYRSADLGFRIARTGKE